MGLYSMMRTSASGMAAQANRLGTVAENIANSSTTGYKRTSTEFSSLILQSGTSEFVSGSVETRIRQSVSEQGALTFTTSTTDLAVAGNGFFVVSNTDGQTYLTRAGSFVTDGEGNLVNAAGYKLMGYDVRGGAVSTVANGTSGLSEVNLGAFSLQANASSDGELAANFPSDAAIVAGADLPSANSATPAFSGKTSLVAYDSQGRAVTLDVYTAKSADGTWEVSAYDHSTATGSGFPYSSGPLATTTYTFDSAGQFATGSPTSLSLTIPGGSAFALDMSQSTQLAAGYTVTTTSVNGNAPSAVQSVQVDRDGTLFAVYENGQRVAVYRIPLANVPSPDNLEAVAGNVYRLTSGSGELQVGTAGTSGLGGVVSGALEQSTVDLASELTTMIESQRNYTANSKVFQTGAELMDVLVNLQR